jgi:hypothetical protein
MARKQQAAELLKNGLPPSEIARQLNTSGAAVMQYLCLMIGEGELRRSDLAFSIPPELRLAAEQAIKRTGSTNFALVSRDLRRHGIRAPRLDLGVYLNYRRARVVLGDMYELVRALEVRLHQFVKQAFIAEYGEEQWWRSGVPDNIRAECAALLEKDPEPAEEPYCYTHMINLREILDKRWPVLSKYMPKELLNKKKDILERLLQLNRIRNSVMHPVRNSVLGEDEFEFVRTLDAELRELTVHMPVAQEDVPLSHDLEQANSGGQPHELVTAMVATADEEPRAESENVEPAAGEEVA